MQWHGVRRDASDRLTHRALPPAQLTGLPRRRRPGMIALAVAMVGVGVLGSVALYRHIDRQVPVLLVTTEVPVGSAITSSDLSTTTIAAGPGVADIPARQEPQVIGLVAATTLRAGTLLSAADLTSRLKPGRGHVLVPVALKPSQLPAEGLVPGDRVLVVPAAGVGGSTAPLTLTAPVAAVVQAVSNRPDSDGLDVIDLLVKSGTGPSLAQQAATGQIALVVTARRPG